MMSLLKDNSFSEILQYLESQKISKPTDPINKKRVVTKNVKNLIDECAVAENTTSLVNKYKDLPNDNPFFHQSSFSNGFDVSRLETLMRMKLVDEHKKAQSYERPYISVSELIGCIRKTYYSRIKIPIDINKLYDFSYLYLYNKIGEKIHQTIQELYDFTDIEKTIISEKFKVKGRVDAIKDNCLVEIKSIDDKKIKDTYIQSHYHQGLIYAYILNTEYNYVINTITIVYIVRNLKKIIPFDVPYDQALANKFINNSSKILLSLSSKKAPDPINSDLEQCKYCPYKEIVCMKDEVELVQKPYEIKETEKTKSIFLM